MIVDFLLLLIFVALVSLNVTLDKIAKVLQQDYLHRTRNEDEEDELILPGDEF